MHPHSINILEIVTYEVLQSGRVGDHGKCTHCLCSCYLCLNVKVVIQCPCLSSVAVTVFFGYDCSLFVLGSDDTEGAAGVDMKQASKLAAFFCHFAKCVTKCNVGYILLIYVR